ncbi:MAG: hypothetical protein K8L99_13510 [Anaerolineae bacterium]|nr:hypothetical protein [Anaerolineae bacterium]
MGPKQDIIAELAKSAQARDMILGVSSHRAEHWWFRDGGRKFDSDVNDPRYERLHGPAMMASPAVDHTESAWRSKEWLHVNGEAIYIYNTRHWYTIGEGSTKVAEGHVREHEDKPFTAEDIRFTVGGNNQYASCLG